MDASPALSILAKARPTLEGRCVGLLVTDGAQAALIRAISSEAKSAGAKIKIVAEKIAGALLSDGKILPADQRVDGGSSTLFDHVAVIASDEGAMRLAGMSAAQDFVRDAFSHLKVIGYTPNTQMLFTKAGLCKDGLDEACVTLAGTADAKLFIAEAAKGKFWAREPAVRPMPDLAPKPKLKQTKGH